MSKKIIFSLFIIFSINNAIFAAPKNNFVPGVSDLPVPINFTLKDDSSSVFFSDAGRIVEATFEGKGEYDDILNFYNKTLRALGWKIKGKLKYSREGEILRIHLNIRGENLEIEFSLRPEKK